MVVPAKTARGGLCVVVFCVTLLGCTVSSGVTECVTSCQNGGTLSNCECSCPDSYKGDTCGEIGKVCLDLEDSSTSSCLTTDVVGFLWSSFVILGLLFSSTNFLLDVAFTNPWWRAKEQDNVSDDASFEGSTSSESVFDEESDNEVTKATNPFTKAANFEIDEMDEKPKPTVLAGTFVRRSAKLDSFGATNRSNASLRSSTRIDPKEQLSEGPGSSSDTYGGMILILGPLYHLQFLHAFSDLGDVLPLQLQSLFQSFGWANFVIRLPWNPSSSKGSLLETVSIGLTAQERVFSVVYWITMLSIYVSLTGTVGGVFMRTFLWRLKRNFSQVPTLNFPGSILVIVFAGFQGLVLTVFHAIFKSGGKAAAEGVLLLLFAVLSLVGSSLYIHGTVLFNREISYKSSQTGPLHRFPLGLGRFLILALTHPDKTRRALNMRGQWTTRWPLFLKTFGVFFCEHTMLFWIPWTLCWQMLFALMMQLPGLVNRYVDWFAYAVIMMLVILKSVTLWIFRPHVSHFANIIETWSSLLDIGFCFFVVVYELGSHDKVIVAFMITMCLAGVLMRFFAQVVVSIFGLVTTLLDMLINAVIFFSKLTKKIGVNDNDGNGDEDGLLADESLSLYERTEHLLENCLAGAMRRNQKSSQFKLDFSIYVIPVDGKDSPDDLLKQASDIKARFDNFLRDTNVEILITGPLEKMRGFFYSTTVSMIAPSCLYAMFRFWKLASVDGAILADPLMQLQDLAVHGAFAIILKFELVFTGDRMPGIRAHLKEDLAFVLNVEISLIQVLKLAKFDNRQRERDELHVTFNVSELSLEMVSAFLDKERYKNWSTRWPIVWKAILQVVPEVRTNQKKISVEDSPW